MPVEAVHPHSGERPQQQRGDLRGEADNSEQECRISEPIDEPAGGDARHPCADQGDALAAKEQPVVAMAQCAQQEPQVGIGGVVGGAHQLPIVNASPAGGPPLCMLNVCPLASSTASTQCRKRCARAGGPSNMSPSPANATT